VKEIIHHQDLQVHHNGGQPLLDRRVTMLRLNIHRAPPREVMPLIAAEGEREGREKSEGRSMAKAPTKGLDAGAVGFAARMRHMVMKSLLLDLLEKNLYKNLKKDTHLANLSRPLKTIMKTSEDAMSLRRELF